MEGMNSSREAQVRHRHKFVSLPWKRIGLFSLIGILVLVVIGQFMFPVDRILPFRKVDGMDLSWQPKSYAIAQLDKAYANYSVGIYITGSDKPVVSPKLSKLDVTVDNSTRINDLDYPWYLRLIPGSFLWVGLGNVETSEPAFGPQFDNFIDANIMPDCKQTPVNATLKLADNILVTVADKDGLSCARDDVIKTMKMISPVLSGASAIHVNATLKPADISEAKAKELADELNQRLGDGLNINVLGNNVTAPASDVLSWLNFTPQDGDIQVSVDGGRAGDWLSKNIAAQVAISPGVSYITTLDFTAISTVSGNNGQLLDVGATIDSIQQAVDGDTDAAVAIPKVVPPSEQYIRTYTPSDDGLSALLSNFAADHTGTFGISVQELDGQNRHANFNGDKQFVTASTFKLLVAYSLLKQIDQGQRSWANDSDCFNRMISLSDNTCADNFIDALGPKTITNDIQAIGLKNSTFMKVDNIYSTPNDLNLLLGMIATGQNFSSVNQNRLISAMKNNIYRSGVPAGVSGTVADKVGFMWGLLHDAAIVYSSHGTYTIAVMTDGSSWGTIADLAGQVDALLAQ